MHFKHLKLLVSIALLLALSVSCTGPITITGVPLRLLANFNADATGAGPNATLPGDPVGDQILNGEGIVDPEVVSEDGNHCLRIFNKRGASHGEGNRLVFRGTTVTYPQDVIYAWKIKIVDPFVAGSFTVNLTDGSGTDHVRLRLMDYTTVPSGEPLFGYLYLMPSREFLGKVPVGQNCSYYVTINPRTNTFSLDVTRPTFTDGKLSVVNHPLLAPMSTGAKNPSIEIRNDTAPAEYYNNSGFLANPTSGWLFLDDLMIQAN